LYDTCEFNKQKKSSWPEIHQQEDLFPPHPPAVLQAPLPPAAALEVVAVLPPMEPAQVLLHTEPAAAQV